MQRRVNDNPKSNVENLLNFAYAKDGNAMLRYALGKDNADLCDVVRDLCPQGGAVSSDIMDGRCFECGDMGNCAAGLLYTTAVQAAELRAALKAYEDTGLEPCDYAAMRYAFDNAESARQTANEVIANLGHAQELLQAEQDGRMVVLPCKVGDTVWGIDWNAKAEVFDVVSSKVMNVRYDSADGTISVGDGEYIRVLGKRCFLTREAAEAALEEGAGK